jgi:hypothetical protein
VPQLGQLAEVTMSKAACATGTITAHGNPPGSLPLALDPIGSSLQVGLGFAIATRPFLIQNILSAFAFENK